MLSASGHVERAKRESGIPYTSHCEKSRSVPSKKKEKKKTKGGNGNVPKGGNNKTHRKKNKGPERTGRRRNFEVISLTGCLLRSRIAGLNGHRTKRLPNNANFGIQFIEGESLLIKIWI